ncbi:MAG: hypothetical protein F4164_13810 [Gemmatimonadales bacterium]|nr:hypothetical protein [Gemmatimonadales bacterium]MYG50409.1 hypothetical protein [Gemmatimonadales bacterium]MYK00615.1 hypothetical protein [Candidatus Palauibacter ramosifaciens]
MEIVLATLADAANTSSDGKLNLMGLFDTLFAGAMPVTHPSMQLVLRIRAEPSETDRQHELEIRCMDEDGQELFKVTGEFSVQAPPGKAATFNHIVGINNLTLQKYGGYTFPIFINRDLKRTVELEVATPDRRSISPEP